MNNGDSRYIFNSSSVRELHRCAKILYETFARADKQLVDNRDNISHSDEIDFSLCPWNYYSIQFGLNNCRIERLRNMRFTIVCNGFTPSLEYYDETKLDNDFYRTTFGNFEHFEEARNAFSEIVNNLIMFKQRLIF